MNYNFRSFLIKKKGEHSPTGILADYVLTRNGWKGHTRTDLAIWLEDVDAEVGYKAALEIAVAEHKDYISWQKNKKQLEQQISGFNRFGMKQLS